jgi:hypothetical protein
VGSSLYNMAVQTSNIISTQIYQNKDKPLYYTGNKVLLGLAAYNVVLFIGAKVYYTLKNKYVFVLCCKKTDVLMKISQRDKIWDAMTREEKLNYLATTKDKGNKRYVLGTLDEVVLIKAIDLISDLLLEFFQSSCGEEKVGSRRKRGIEGVETQDASYRRTYFGSFCKPRSSISPCLAINDHSQPRSYASMLALVKYFVLFEQIQNNPVIPLE